MTFVRPARRVLIAAASLSALLLAAACGGGDGGGEAPQGGAETRPLRLTSASKVTPRYGRAETPPGTSRRSSRSSTIRTPTARSSTTSSQTKRINSASR